MTARASLPVDYPSSSPPVAEIDAPSWPPGDAEAAAALLAELFAPGEVVLFAWLEAVRERQAAWAEAREREGGGPAGGGGGAAGGGGGSSGGSDDEDQDDDEDEDEAYEEVEGGEEAALAAAARARERRAAAASASGCDGDTGGDGERRRMEEEVATRIVSGAPMTERRSTFQAHVCRVSSPEEVGAVISVLLRNSK